MAIYKVSMNKDTETIRTQTKPKCDSEKAIQLQIIITIIIQEVLETTNRLLSLIRHGQHIKLHCCVCIRCRGNVFTELLPNKFRGMYVQTHRPMEGI
jgi:hypothetical protein